MYRPYLKAIWLLAKSFVDDIKTLFLDGVMVKIGLDDHTYHSTLVTFLANTAADHKVVGFKESAYFAHRVTRLLLKSCFSTEAT